MPDSGLSTAREGVGDDRTVALGVVALVAQERDRAGGGLSQVIEQCALGGEVLAKITEEARQIAVLA